MKKMMITAVLLMTVMVGTGCDFTAAQLTDWTTGTSGLAGLIVGGFWDLNVTPTLNPTGDKVTQGFLDLGKKVSTQLVSNRIQQEIPLAPGSIK